MTTENITPIQPDIAGAGARAEKVRTHFSRFLPEGAPISITPRSREKAVAVLLTPPTANRDRHG
jgi:hypothetical protein